MADHLVALPGGAGLAPETRAAIATLALAASFAAPGAGPHDLALLERDLLARFAGATTIDAPAVLAYFASLGATALDLADLVAQFATNPVALHTALQQHNDAGGLVLLAVASPAQLSDAASGVALHPSAQGPLWLLRSGYGDDPPYGYYYDLAASGTQPVRILWNNVTTAGILAAIALEAPTPPVDMAALLSTLQGANDALAHANDSLAAASAALSAAGSAHQAILASLGKG